MLHCGTSLRAAPAEPLMLPDARDYATLVSAFRWAIPPRFNMGVAVTDAWAARAPDRPAILEAGADFSLKPTTYGELSDRSNRLANVLRRLGVRPGERVAILLPQSADVLSVEGADGTALGLPEEMAKAPPEFAPVDTGPDDPALMIYTSGTTGPPKGALHGHRVLLGHLPGVEFAHEFTPQPGDRFWTPADWAWAGGLLNALLPSLYFGVPVVARKAEKFDPEEAFALMARAGVRNAFVPQVALRVRRAVEPRRQRFGFDLRTVASAGEALGAETFAWAREALGLTVNEIYGQTECNLVLGSCAAIGVSRPGAIGKPVPGHEAAVIRADGTLAAVDEIGQIAIRRPNPVMFLSYWNQPEATATKFLGDWMLTGDQGVRDADGYVRFLGRDDDVITSSGYRIGPGEIEDCLLRHPAVALAAVVGKPDAVRTEIVKAFIVARPGAKTGPALVDELKSYVRTRLAAHEYPREIEFVASLPMTTTGKIIRRELRDRG